MIRCAKPSSTPVKNLATCTSCNGDTTIYQKPDSTDLWYYLPSAFTPNNDGINDVFKLVYSKRVNEDSSTITIWDKNGNGVFEGTVNQVWKGKDTKGNLCPAGHYPLYLKIMTSTGVWKNQCGCVTILTYKGNCIYTGGVAYSYFDQIDTANGFTNTTYDHICP